MSRNAPLRRHAVREVPVEAATPAVDWRAKAGDFGRVLKERAPTQSDLDSMRGRLPVFDAPKLGDMLSPDQNSFGVMRFLLAAAVLVSHAFYLYYGRVSAEPLYAITGYTLGQHAVQIFFFLSGVMVAQSLAQSQDVRDYAIARALRIFPALVVCVLLTALALGPWLTTLGRDAYLKDLGVIEYIAKTIALVTGSAALPGVFETNTVPHVVNTSLWTLKYEVLCYAILAAIGALAIRSGRATAVVTAIAALWFAAMITLRPELRPAAALSEVLTYFSLFFGAGAVAYLLRDQIRLHGAIVLALGAFAAYALRTSYAEIAMALFLGYGVLWLATFRFGGWRAFANTSDLSYGVYIYSMPVTQTLIALQPGINLVSLIAAAAGITLVIAFLSWELIERPALALRHKLKRAPAPAVRRPAPTPTQTPTVAATAASVAGRMRLPKVAAGLMPAKPVAPEPAPEVPAQPAVSGDRLRLAVRKPAPASLTAAERAELVQRLKSRGLATSH